MKSRRAAPVSAGSNGLVPPSLPYSLAGEAQTPLPLSPSEEPNQAPPADEPASEQLPEKLVEPADSGEPEAGNSPEELQQPSDGASDDSGIPETIRKASSLRPILVFLQDEHGLTDVDQVVEAVKNLKDEVPYLKRMKNIPDRVKRTLKVMEQA